MLANPAPGKDVFVKSVEDVMNNNVFGRIDKHGMDLGQWRFPLKDGKLSDFKFSRPDAC